MNDFNQTVQSMNQHLNAVYAKIEEKGGKIPVNKNMANLAPSILSIGGDAAEFLPAENQAMCIADRVRSMASHLRAAYASVATRGGDLPAQLNLANLAAGVESIPTGPVAPKSLAELKAALKAGRAIAVGAEIPDTYNGNSNPLIVYQQLDNSNNSAYGGAAGVLLGRKYIEPVEQVFSLSNNGLYNSATIRNFLQTTYYENCSDELKSIINDINISWWNGSSMLSITSKWFLLSNVELCMGSGNNNEGMMLDYWKQKTGQTSPQFSGDRNYGRTLADRNGTVKQYWTRTKGSQTYYEYCIDTSGRGQQLGPNLSYGVAAVCFVSGN